MIDRSICLCSAAAGARRTRTHTHTEKDLGRRRGRGKDTVVSLGRALALPLGARPDRHYGWQDGGDRVGGDGDDTHIYARFVMRAAGGGGRVLFV
jgi:hypothetical protein